MENIEAPNDIDIEVKGIKTCALSKPELQQLFYTQLVDSFQDALDPEECPIAITNSHQLRRYDHEDVHYRFDVSWLNGEKTSVRADAMSLQHPDMVADYVVAKKLQSKPAFSWVEEYIETNQDIKAIIININMWSAKKYDFSIEVSNNLKHVLVLDQMNGDSLWKDSVDKELAEINQHKTFRVPNKDYDLSEYKRLLYHIIFNCKFDGRRKARLVIQGNLSDPPKEDIYSGVVNMDSVRLAFYIVAMNGLSVCVADISTAFLYGKLRKKVYIITGKEFEDLEGQL